jgi:hypothetical protein
MSLESATYISQLIDTNPSGLDNPNNGDNHIRLIKSALLTTFQNITGAVTASHSELNLLDGLSANKLENAELLEATTKALFYQAAAPTNWTQDTATNDKVLRIVSGSGAGTGGDWTISGVTVDDHILIENELPAHNHTASTNSAGAHTHNVYTVYGSGSISGFNDASTEVLNGNTISGTAHTSSVSAHSHTVTVDNTGGDAGHNHGLTADGTWRPSYIDVIACTKDAYT